MGRIRLIGLDLDGTLLNEEKRITEHTLHIMEEAKAQGIYLVPVTGRPHLGIPAVVRELPMIRYVISCNGATIRDVQEDCVLRSKAISPQEGVRLGKVLQEHKASYEILVEGQGYSEPWVYEAMVARSPKNTFLPRYIKETRKTVSDLLTFMETCPGVEEFFVMGGVQEGLVEALKTVAEIDVVFPALKALELTARGVNKGEALLHLAAHLGIAKEEVLAIGDSGNDVEMLRAAGLSVAMGNATEAVKAMTHAVTDTNEQEGVAKAIARYALARG